MSDTLGINVSEKIGTSERVGPGEKLPQPMPILFNVVEVYFENDLGRTMVKRVKLEKNIFVPPGQSKEIKVKVAAR